MITIALDAMGGDHAPRAEVEGAVLAARELGVRVLLVGIEPTVRQELTRHKPSQALPIEIVARHRSDHDERFAVAGLPAKEGQLAARGGAAWCATARPTRW